MSEERQQYFGLEFFKHLMMIISGAVIALCADYSADGHFGHGLDILGITATLVVVDALVMGTLAGLDDANDSSQR